MSGDANPFAVPVSAFPWAVSVLFMFFLVIVLAFEILVGIISYLSQNALHLKGVLVERLKEELLALGIVSLVVSFLSPSLNKICADIPPSDYDDYHHEDYHDAPADAPPPDHSSAHLPPPPPSLTGVLAGLIKGAHGEAGHCPEGQEQVFPSSVVNASHYLLFWIAVVQICYVFLTAVFTTVRFKRIFTFELIIRSQQAARKSSRKARPGSKKLAAAGASGPSWTLPQAPVDLAADEGSGPAVLVSQSELLVKPGPVAEALENGAYSQLPGLPDGQGGVTLPDIKVTQQGGRTQASYPDGSPQALPNGRAASFPLRQTPFQPSGSLPAHSDTYGTQESSGVDVEPHACVGCGNCPAGLHVFFCGGLTSRLYKGLRRFLLLRIQVSTTWSELRTVNLATASEQMVQHEMNAVHAHTWLQVMCVALLMLYTGLIQQVIWASLVAFIMLIPLTYKMYSISSRVADLMERLEEDAKGAAGAAVGGADETRSPRHTVTQAPAIQDMTAPAAAYTHPAYAGNVPAARQPGGGISLAAASLPVAVNHSNLASTNMNENEDVGGHLVHAHTASEVTGAQVAPASPAAQLPTPVLQGAASFVVRVGPVGHGTTHTPTLTINGQPLDTLGSTGTGVLLGTAAHAPAAATVNRWHTFQPRPDVLKAHPALSRAVSSRRDRTGLGTTSVPVTQLQGVGEGGQQSGPHSPQVGQLSGDQSRCEVQMAQPPRMPRPPSLPALPHPSPPPPPAAGMQEPLVGSNAAAPSAGGGGGATPRTAARKSVAFAETSSPGSPSQSAQPTSPATASSFAARTPFATVEIQVPAHAAINVAPETPQGRNVAGALPGEELSLGLDRHGPQRSEPYRPSRTMRAHLQGENSGLPASPSGTPGRLVQRAATFFQRMRSLRLPTTSSAQVSSVEHSAQSHSQGPRSMRRKMSWALSITRPLADGLVGEGADPEEVQRVRTLTQITADDVGGHGILWCDVPSDIDEDEPSDTVTGSSTDLEAALTQPAPSLHPMPTMTADGVLHPHMSALHPAASQRLHQPTELDAAVTHGPSTAQSASSAIATLEVVPSIKQGGKMGLDSSPHHAPWPPTHQDQDEERVTYMIPQLPYMQQPGAQVGPMSHHQHMAALAAHAHHGHDDHKAYLSQLPPGFVTRVHGLDRKVKECFWFKWPGFILWLVQLAIVCNSSCLTICIYILASYTSSPAGDVWVDLIVWLAVACFNLLVGFYIGWVIVPQYALLSTSASVSPEALHHLLKWSKVAAEEHEHGVAGAVAHVLNKTHHAHSAYQKARRRHRRQLYLHLTQQQLNKHGHAQVHPTPAGHQQEVKQAGDASTQDTAGVAEHNEPGHTAQQAGHAGPPGPPHSPGGSDHDHGISAAGALSLANAYVAAVAQRAGIVTASSHVVVVHSVLARQAPFLVSFLAVWVHKALVARGLQQPLQEPYLIAGGPWLRLFRAAFHHLDVDDTGFISAEELQEHLRHELGMRVSRGELRAMMGEAGYKVPVTSHNKTPSLSSGPQGQASRLQDPGYLREPSSTLEAPSAAPSYSYSRPPPTISSSVSASASEQPLYLHKRTPTQEQLGAEAAAVTHSFVTPRHTSSGHTASGSLAAPSVGTDPASQSTAVLRSAVPGEGDVGGDRPSSTGGVDGRGTPSRQTQDSSGGGARGQGSRQRRRSFLAVAAANMGMDSICEAVTSSSAPTAAAVQRPARGISFNQFVTYCAYALLDPSRCGEVDAAQLHSLSNLHGLPISPLEARAMIELGDVNNSGSITAAEFLSLMHGVVLKE